MTNEGRIVYTLQTGEQVALPQGNPLNKGDRVLVHPTPDGRYVTMGNNGIKKGDKVIVLTTNQGEKVSVNVQPEPTNDWVWAYILPFKDHQYSVDDILHITNSMDLTIQNSGCNIPPCRCIKLKISLDVWTIGAVEYRMDFTSDNTTLSATNGIDTFANIIGDMAWGAYQDLYTIPVEPGVVTQTIGSEDEDSPEMPAGSFAIRIPKGTLGNVSQMQINYNPPPAFNYFYFPPYQFNGEYTLTVLMRKTDVLNNPDLYELV
ncbi:MAG: hypothetical protein K8E24_011960 [Methanobacterium paludis]|nr:hypothetical protein [Methanobacterium paludis]